MKDRDHKQNEDTGNLWIVYYIKDPNNRLGASYPLNMYI